MVGMAQGRLCPSYALRAPDAAQRAVLHGAVRCRAGAVTDAGAWYGPGSAERHEECRNASGTQSSQRVGDGAQILPGQSLVGWRAQEIGGMKRRQRADDAGAG